MIHLLEIIVILLVVLIGLAIFIALQISDN